MTQCRSRVVRGREHGLGARVWDVSPGFLNPPTSSFVAKSQKDYAAALLANGNGQERRCLQVFRGVGESHCPECFHKPKH